MKGKLIAVLLICICCLKLSTTKAQSLYEIKFTDAAATEYLGLLVYFNEENSYMRIAFTLNGVYNVVHVDYKSITGINKQNENYFYLKSTTSPSFITTASKTFYTPDYFIWYGTGKNQTGPYQTSNNDFSNQQKVKSYTQLTPAKLTVTYVRQFFSSTESKYFAMRKICGLDKSVLASLQLNLPSTKMHFIMAANTRESSIGISCTIDERAMEKEFQDIAKTLNIEFIKHTIMDDNYSRENLDAELNKLQPGKNDIVVFAYSGHGFRWDNQTEQYPNMDLRNSEYMKVSETNSLSASDVYNAIIKKGARLNIVLTDCCNSKIGRNQITTSGFLNTKSNVNADVARLQRLFMTAKGNIIAAAAQPGEFATGNNADGGFFTHSFIQALREEISYFKTESSSWDSIVLRTLELAKNKTSPGVCATCTVQSGLRYTTVLY